MNKQKRKAGAEKLRERKKKLEINAVKCFKLTNKLVNLKQLAAAPSTVVPTTPRSQRLQSQELLLVALVVKQCRSSTTNRVRNRWRRV